MHSSRAGGKQFAFLPCHTNKMISTSPKKKKNQLVNTQN
jgi:hypothetical protein